MNGRCKKVARIGDDLHAVAVSQDSAERFTGNRQGIYDMGYIVQFCLLEMFMLNGDRLLIELQVLSCVHVFGGLACVT